VLLQYLQAWQDVSGCDSEEAVVAYWRARGYTEFDFDHDGSLRMSLTTPGEGASRFGFAWRAFLVHPSRAWLTTAQHCMRHAVVSVPAIRACE
jgi:hypothetical protein